MTPIPAWPNSATPEGKTFFANAKAILAAWRAKGVGNPFAFGMLAQGEAESSLDPNAKGDHVKGEPTAFGLYQRHKPRLDAIKRVKGIDIFAAVLAGKNTIDNEVEASWWELKTMAYIGVKAIASQSTAYGAAYQACALFERAGAADAADRRGKMAETWTMWAAGEWPASRGQEPEGWRPLI